MEENTGETQEMETQQTNEGETSQETEKSEKSTDRQPTAEEFRAMDGAKRHFEEENKKLKDELSKAQKASQSTAGDPLEVVRLGKALAEHSEEEADVVITFAKGKFNTLNPTPEQLIQASKDDWVQGAIKSRRDKVESERKTPEPSSPISVIGGKTPEEIGNLPPKEFEKFAREALRGGRSGI